MSDEAAVVEDGSDRMTCERCGATYAAGAPHRVFCRGKVKEGDECVCCGQDDLDFLKECACGEIVCECCVEDGTHDC